MILVSFNNLHLKHGSVATQLKFGGIVNNRIIASCRQSVPVNKCKNWLIFGKVICTKTKFGVL